MFEIKRLQEDRGAIINEMNQLTATITREKRAMNNEELDKFDRMDSDQKAIAEKIESQKRFDRVGVLTERDDNSGTLVRSDSYKPNKVTKHDRQNAFKHFLLRSSGKNSKIKPWMVESARRCGTSDNDNDSWEVSLSHDGNITRAEETDVGSEGGFLMNDGLFIGLERNIKAYGGLRKVARVRRFDSGEPVHYAYSDSTATLAVVQNTSGTPSQNSTVANSNVVYSKIPLTVWDYVTGVFPISIQSLEDPQYDIMSDISEVVGQSLGRGSAKAYQQGSGTNEPTGLLTAASAALTTAGAGGPTYIELVKALHSIDIAFHDEPSFGWVMPQSSFSYLMQLEDQNQRPLSWNYTNSLASGMPFTLLNKPVTVDNSMPAFAAGGAFCEVGAFDRFFIRDVRDARIFVLREALMPSLSIGILGLLRTDCALLNVNAIKKIVIHA